MFCDDFSQFIVDKGYTLFDQKDAQKYAECAAEAFYDYPLMHHFFEDDIFDSAFLCYMEQNFSSVLKGCVLFADSPEVNAICMVGEPFLNNVVDIELLSGNKMKILGHCKYKNIKRIIDFQRYCIEVKYKWTGGDSIHCVFLAVRPDMQKNGIGSGMLRAVHEYADIIKKPVFLDTHKPIYVEIYKKLGYELMDSVPYEGTDTNHNALVRFPLS